MTTDTKPPTRPRAHRRKVGPLVRFIRKHYGSNRALAQVLEVTPQTVSNYLTRDPLQLLKHLDKLRDDLDITAGPIMRAAMDHQRWLNEASDKPADQ